MINIIHRVKIGDTIYVVVDREGDEVCILQTFPYVDGINRQLKIWTKEYEIIYD